MSTTLDKNIQEIMLKCEHCEKLRQEGEFLHTVNDWLITTITTDEQRKKPWWWYVCSACYETRQKWCANVYPDNCEICGAEIEEAEHFREKKVNRGGTEIDFYGISLDETCRIICENCWNKINQEKQIS